MNKARPVKSFEEVLHGHVEMCYSVALTLTRDPYEAQRLTQGVMTWAWHFVDDSDGEAKIKMKLLTALRTTFRHERQHASLAESR